MINPDSLVLEYSTAVQKGRRMLTMMQSQIAQIKSPYLTADDVKALGYTRIRRDLSPPGFSSILNRLRIRGTSSDCIRIRDTHAEAITIGGILVPATNAEFISDINVEAGLLVALSNRSPTSEAQISGWQANTPLPSLKYWSDVAFLHWAHAQQSPQGVSSLKFILRANIQNKHTLTVISRIRRFLPCYSQDCRCPGRYFNTDSDETVALLGTPHGAGVAWLLAQHRDQLGQKVIDGVRLYSYKSLEYPRLREFNLLFYIRDAKLGEPAH